MTYQVKLNWIRTLEHIFESHIFWLKYITNHDKVITNNGSFFLLQINSVKFLQIATGITNYDKIITKYDNYYK